MMPSSEALGASAGPGTRSPSAEARADRGDAGPGGAKRAVDLHEPPLVELDAGLGQAELLNVRAASGGDHEVVDLGRLLPVGEGAALLTGDDVGDRDSGVQRYALSLQPPLDQSRDVGVLGR